MPRPTHNPGAAASAKPKSKFSISGILRGRKERRRMQRETAAKAITNNTAENELRIIDVLAGTNFVRSPIPAETLNYKSDPNQQWGDLEYGARAAQKMIRNASNFNMDISAVDERLFQLAVEFKNAVTEGNVRAAYAAKGALITCISKIRNRIPFVSPALAEGFIESGAKYIDTWLLLVDSSRVADELARNAENERVKYKADEAKLNAANNDAFDQIQNNDMFLEAYKEIMDQTAPTDPAKWSPAMHDVRKMLVDQRFAQANIHLTLSVLEKQELKLRNQESMIDTLSTKVNCLPVPEDPDALNKYNEEVDGIISELARIDTEVDEMLGTIEKIDGTLTALEEAPGAVHLRDMMAVQAEKFIEELQEQQRREVESQGPNKLALLKSFGLNTIQEQEALKEKNRLAQEEMMRQALEEKQNDEFDESESQYQYEE